MTEKLLTGTLSLNTNKQTTFTVIVSSNSSLENTPRFNGPNRAFHPSLIDISHQCNVRTSCNRSLKRAEHGINGFRREKRKCHKPPTELIGRIFLHVAIDKTQYTARSPGSSETNNPVKKPKEVPFAKQSQLQLRPRL